MRSTLRSGRTLALAAVYLLVLAGMAWYLWPAQGVYSVTEQASRSIVTTFTLTLMGLVILYAPPFSATSVVSERERNSFDLLYATRLRPHEILLGKLFASIALLVLFVVLSFPFFAASFFLGAVSVAETVRIYGAVLLTALLTALIGLAVSTRARHSHGALMTTYFLLVFLAVFPWLPWLLLRNLPDWAPAAYRLRALSPPAAVASILLPGFDPAHLVSATGAPAWQFYFAYAIGLSLLIALYLLVYFQHPYRGRGGRAEGVIDDRRRIVRRKLRFPFYLIDPMRRRKHLAGWVNPIFAREMRSKAFGGGIWVFRGAYLCLAGSVLLMIVVLGQLGRFDPHHVKAIAIGFQVALVVLFVPSLTASAVSHEHERFSFDGLRMAHIGPGTFLRGKVWQALLFVLFLLIGSIPLWVVVAFMRLNTPNEILVAWAVVGATILLAISAGLCASSCTRRSPAAAAAAYGFMVVLVAGTLFPYLAAARFAPAAREAILTLNPFVVSFYVLHTESVTPLPILWPQHLTLSLSASLLLLAVAYLRLRHIFQPDR